MKYPFTKCLHPRLIVNPYTHQEIEVSCGVCKACLLNRCSKMSHLCSLEEQEHKYCLFFTLTYSDEFVPVAVPVVDAEHGIVDFVSRCTRLKDEGLVICSDYDKRHCSKGWLSLLQNKTHLDCISYVSKRDCQLFLKRVRKNLKKHTDEKLRYYLVSEYGPKTFRAHYHGMFFFDEERTLKVLPQVIRKSWPYGRIDCSLSRGKCSSYLSGYLNSNYFIPPFLACGSSKPFALHSTFFAQGFYRRQKKEIYEDEPERFVRVGRTVSGKFVEFMPWRSLACTFFPRCRGFDGKSFEQLYRSYTILLEIERAFGKSFQYLSLVKVSESILFQMSQMFGDVYGNVRKIPSFERVCKYFMDEYPPSYFRDAFSSDEVFERTKHRIYSDLLVSRHFLDFVCDHRSSFECRRKVSMIVSYWREREMTNLNDWYRSQEEYGEKFSDFGYSAFYYNKPHLDDLPKHPLYKNFVVDVDLQYNRSIKHKRHNDANMIFVYS